MHISELDMQHIRSVEGFVNVDDKMGEALIVKVEGGWVWVVVQFLSWLVGQVWKPLGVSAIFF